MAVVAVCRCGGGDSLSHWTAVVLTVVTSRSSVGGSVRREERQGRRWRTGGKPPVMTSVKEGQIQGRNHRHNRGNRKTLQL